MDAIDAPIIGVSFGNTDPGLPTDINRDKLVDSFDIVLVSGHFRKEPLMSEPKEPDKTGQRRRLSATSATAIKTLCQAIETGHDNGALFFLAQALLRGGRLPTTSKELAEAIREAARWLQQG